ncbi:sugar ABC transporter permease, partial [Bacillus sp. S34]|nr:sugar ABC transporter permease [Bacillus sp. S34]
MCITAKSPTESIAARRRSKRPLSSAVAVAIALDGLDAITRSPVRPTVVEFFDEPSLAAIDDNLSEAAAIDGSGAWSRFWHVTLPGIRPIIVLLLILRLGEALSVGFERRLLVRRERD